MLRRLLLVVAAVALLAGPAFAGPGLYAGFTTNPDDFLVGLHFQVRPIAGFSVVPSVEGGFGDVTMFAGNADVHYALPLKAKFGAYVGAGLTENWFDFDEGSEWDFGGSIIAGGTFTKFSLEAKFGLGDTPDFKLAVAFTM
jgi:hypothetical protein